MRVDLVVHIAAGAIGIISGFIALSTNKGATMHRKSGMVFVYAMMTMALMGSAMAVVRNVAPGANAPVGILTAYLVITGLITVRPASAGSRWLNSGLMFAALTTAAILFTFAFEVLESPTGKMYGMPVYPFLVFASIALLGGVGDLRLIRAGGIHVIRGAPRLTRHLWRMSTALLIAAFSFFLGQAKVIPKPIRLLPLLVIPPLIVFAALMYWLWRIRVRRSLRGIVRISAPEVA